MTAAPSPDLPGPGLGVRLALVDAGALPDEALMGFVHDQYRQLAFQQEQVWAALAEVARRPPLHISADAALTAERQLDLAAAEISAELRLSQFAAERELSFGLDLQELPRVAAALRAGDLDRVKAVVLLEALRDLSEAHRDAILDEVLPVAATVRVSDLKGRVQRLAIALDPAWAERRYREAVKHKRVVRYINADGSVTIAAEDQDAAEALAAYARLTALARAAKRAGAHATLDTLRSDITLGLLGSRFAGLRDTDLIAYLVDKYPKAMPEPTDHEVPDHEPVEDEPVEDEPVEDEPVDDEPVDDGVLDFPPAKAGSVERKRRIREPRTTGRRPSRLSTIECTDRPIRAALRSPDSDPDPPPF